MANLNSRQKRRNAYWQQQEAQQAAPEEKMPRMRLVDAIDALSPKRNDGRPVQDKVNGYSTETLSGIQQAVIHAEEVLKNGTEKDPRIVANYQTLVSKKEILNTASQKRIKDVEKGKRQIRPEEQKYYDSLVANTPKKESLLTRAQNKAKGAWNSVKETAGDARDSFQQWNTERKEHNAEKKAQKEAEKKRQQEEQAKWEAERMAQLREFLQEKKKQDEHQAEVRARAERIRNVKKEKAKKLRREKMKAKKETVTKWFSDAKGKVAEKYGVTKDGVKDWWQERKAEKARKKEEKQHKKEIKKRAKRIKRAKRRAKWSNRWKTAKKWLKRLGKIALYAAAGAAIYATGGLATVALVGGLYAAKKGYNAYKARKQTKNQENINVSEAKPKAKEDTNENSNSQSLTKTQQYQKDNLKISEESLSQVISGEKPLDGKMAFASDDILRKVTEGKLPLDENNGKLIAAWLAINQAAQPKGIENETTQRNKDIENKLKALGIEIPKVHDNKVSEKQTEGQNLNSENQKQEELQRPKENNTQETEETKDNKNNTQTQQPQKSEAQQRVELESLGIKEETAKKIYEDMNALRQYKQEYPNDKEGIQGLTESVEKNIKGQGDRGTADYGYKLDEKQQAAVKALYPDLFQPKEGQKENTNSQSLTQTQQYQKDNLKISEESLNQVMSGEKPLDGKMAFASDDILRKVTEGKLPLDESNGKLIASWLAVNQAAQPKGIENETTQRNTDIENKLKALGIETPKIQDYKGSEKQAENQNLTGDKKSDKINGEELFQKLDKLDKEHPLPDGSSRAERYGKAMQEYQTIKDVYGEKAAANNLKHKLFNAGHTDKNGKSDFIGMPKELASEFQDYLGQQDIVKSFKKTKQKQQTKSNTNTNEAVKKAAKNKESSR